MEERCRTIYRIRVEHDYFVGRMPQLVRLSLSPRGRRQADRNGMLFRQLDTDEWVLLYNGVNPVSETEIELGMSINDPAFWLYSEYPEYIGESKFGLQDTHVLTIPQKKENVDKEQATARQVIDVMEKLENVQETFTVGEQKLKRVKRRGIQEPFCLVYMQLDPESIPKKETDPPHECVLRFRAKSSVWKFTLHLEHEVNESAGTVMLRDTAKTIVFERDAEEEKKHSGRCRCYKSSAPVAMRSSYGCRLRVALEESRKNDSGKEEVKALSVLLPHVEPPRPGRYLDTEKGILRQICHY